MRSLICCVVFLAAVPVSAQVTTIDGLNRQRAEMNRSWDMQDQTNAIRDADLNRQLEFRRSEDYLSSRGYNTGGYSPRSRYSYRQGWYGGRRLPSRKTWYGGYGVFIRF